MKYKFTRVVAHVEITFGVLIIFVGIALAVAAVMVPTSWLRQPTVSVADRSVVALAVFLLGLVLGASCIVTGQISLVFLDIARRVARMDRRQRRSEDSPPDESRWINRLRRR
jgi:hypothetical protein